MELEICAYCKEELTAYEVMLKGSCCLICERLYDVSRKSNQGCDKPIMDNPEFINPSLYERDFNANEFNRSLDIISLLTWGLNNRIVFKNEYHEVINSVESILRGFTKGSYIYIETTDINFVKLLQRHIKNGREEYPLENQINIKESEILIEFKNDDLLNN